MRVIGGTAGGRRLATPRGMATRPTADRVKEALFNILNGAIEQIETCTVLDVFAGTGNLGIEALSRGVRHAVFIDSSRDAARLIARNLQTTGFTNRAQVVARDYRAAFTLLAAAGRTFRLVFLDPPYGNEPLEACLTALATSTLLEEGTVLVAEHSSRDHFAETYGPLQQWDKRIYGDTALTFYTKPWKGQP
jgi:16S rRNA (guanine966-N2)-methyltransferase